MDTPASPIGSGAGFGIRAGARLIDVAFGFVLAFGVSMLCAIVFAVLARLGRLSGDWAQLLQQSHVSGFVLSLLGGFCYHTVAEATGSTTLGKLLCGLRVVHTDGRPVSFKGAVYRNVGYYWDGLFFGLIGYNSMGKSALRQRYGDVWARTVVVKLAAFQPRPERSPVLVTLGLFAGAGLWAAAIVADMILKVA